jgi:lysosomal acid phosphatase
MHFKEIESQDPGSLTLDGSLQMFNLGRNLRHRYLKLIPKNGFYSQKVISVKSSWKDRTIMSAQSFLAAFMPPLENLNKLPFAWQPVPVYSIRREIDDLIAQKRPCPKYDQVYDQVMKSDPVRQIDEENQALYRHLSVSTGENVSSLLDVELLHNTLEAEQSAGWDLPDWTESIFPARTLPLAERYLRLITETPFMKRIKAGPLVTDVIENMSNKINNLPADRNIHIYSAHDVTLVNVMNSMNILNQTSNKPDYASALVFELHQSHSSIDMDVKIYYYYDSNDKYPKSVTIDKCEFPCPFRKFKRLMNGLAVNDFEKLCEIS